MSFIADNKQLRTYDPERGFELKRDMLQPSDGSEFMRLEGPDSSLEFTMRTTFEPAAPAETGSAKPVIVRHVNLRGFALGGFTLEETKQLIVEALEAFKGIHGRFPDETVRVLFR